MKKLIGAAVVGQSGGPTVAINATLCGVIRGAVENKDVITTLYGMRNGVEGLLNDRLIDLTAEFYPDGELAEGKLRLLAQTPAAALGSCRKKLPDPDTDTGRETFEKMLDIFEKHGIKYFFYIGGNDSMDTVNKLNSYVVAHGREMRVIGLPKTIDNDLMVTDHTPGFGSAAKYIATTMHEILHDCAIYTTPAVTVVEIMGRDSGWLTASAALSRLTDGFEPDYVYLPERDFDEASFISDIRAALERHPNVVIAVSEGLRCKDGTYVGEGAQSGIADVFGRKYLAGTGKVLEGIVKREFNCKTRTVELNTPQRCAAHLASKTDLLESIGVGAEGVHAAVSGESGCMIAMVREGSDFEGQEYSVSFNPVKIANVANYAKTVPDEYINGEGNGVTDECLEYILPLIRGEWELIMEKGIPSTYIFR